MIAPVTYPASPCTHASKFRGYTAFSEIGKNILPCTSPASDLEQLILQVFSYSGRQVFISWGGFAPRHD